MPHHTFDAYCNSLFDTETNLSSQQWLKHAVALANMMNASEEKIEKLKRVLEHVDWSNVDEWDFQTLFIHLTTLEIAAPFVPHKNLPTHLLDNVFDIALHRSSSEDVGALFNIFPNWYASSGLVRDYIAHLVYNNFYEGHDQQKSFVLFLNRCTPEIVIAGLRHPDFDFSDPGDHNWEPSFVCTEIDQCAQEWNPKHQQQLLDAVAPRDLFPMTEAFLQRSVLTNVVAHTPRERSTGRKL